MKTGDRVHLKGTFITGSVVQKFDAETVVVDFDNHFETQQLVKIAELSPSFLRQLIIWLEQLDLWLDSLKANPKKELRIYKALTVILLILSIILSFLV